METQELEKLIKKLEEIDIPRWKYTYEEDFSKYFLFMETNGLRFSIAASDDQDRYNMFIENVEEDLTTNRCLFINYIFDKKNKYQLEIIGKFYKKTLASLRGYKEKQIKEKLDQFLEN